MTTTEPRTTGVPADDPDRMRNAVPNQLRHDRVPAPAILLETGTEDFGSEAVPKDCFVSREYHEREVRYLWAKVWQMACRERDLPNPGDFVTYDIVNESVIIARQSDGSLKAFHNVCQHRGNKLVEGNGRVNERGRFACTFHSWSWDLDGSLAWVPCKWDFPNVTSESNRLAEVKVDTWDGWVFVNFDPACQPLSEFLGEVVPRHFLRWPMAERRVVMHSAKVMPCNWKLALEAFMEDYHVFRAHPEARAYAYDAGARYDQWGHHGRFIQLVGKPTPQVAEGVYSEQDIIDALLGASVQVGTTASTPTVPEGETARSFLADVTRQALGEAYRLDLSEASDSEIVDAIEYFVFPNFTPWGGYSLPIVYRVRPNGDDHETCLFEMMLLAWDGDDPGPDVALTVIASEQSWTEAPGMPPGLGYILDQDYPNLRKLQAGLKSSGISKVNFGHYIESNIRALHHGVEEYLSRGET